MKGGERKAAVGWNQGSDCHSTVVRMLHRALEPPGRLVERAVAGTPCVWFSGSQ